MTNFQTKLSNSNQMIWLIPAFTIKSSIIMFHFLCSTPIFMEKTSNQICLSSLLPGYSLLSPETNVNISKELTFLWLSKFKWLILKLWWTPFDEKWHLIRLVFVGKQKLLKWNQQSPAWRLQAFWSLNPSGRW